MPKSKFSILISLLLVACLLVLLGLQSGMNLEQFQSAIKGLGILAPIAFIAIYAFAPSFFIPITPLSVTAGVLFGPILGTALTVIGQTCGASVSFLLSRYLIKDYVDKKSPAKIDAVQSRLEKDGWKFIAFARITPIFPFNVQNYIFGVTNISLKTFILTSALSLIPGAFAFVYLGYAGKSAISGDSDVASKLVMAAILLLLIAVLPFIVKRISNQKQVLS